MVFLLPSLTQTGIFSEVKLEFFFSLLLLVGAFSVPCSRFIRYIAFIAVTLTIITRIIGQTTDVQLFKVMEIMLSVLMLSLYIILMMHHFLTDTNSSRQRLVGAITIYLILGLIWARFFELVLMFNSDAISMTHNHGLPTLIYFSFVTLATLGYGDVIPVSPLAQNLAIMEGILGQLYLVIFISSLVSEKFTKDLNR
jgi:hypothetical protein